MSSGESEEVLILVLLKAILYFWPYLGAFWGIYFLGFLSKSKLCSGDALIRQRG